MRKEWLRRKGQAHNEHDGPRCSCGCDGGGGGEHGAAVASLAVATAAAPWRGSTYCELTSLWRAKVSTGKATTFDRPTTCERRNARRHIRLC